MNGIGTRTSVWLFIVINILVLITVFFLFLRQPINELRLGIASVRLQESRLAIRERNLAAMEENEKWLAAWEEIRFENAFFTYEGLADALAYISQTARGYGITERAFEAGVPVTRETAGYGRAAAEITVTEITVEASYEGSYADLCRFIEAITNETDGYFIKRLVLDKTPEQQGLSAARVILALYGIGGGDE